MRKNIVLIVCVIFGIVALWWEEMPLSTQISAQINNGPITVIVDPGHGGEDGGTVSVNGVMEKEINLSISLYLSELLDDAGYNVILTREGDYSIGDSSLDTVAARKASDIKRRTEICNSSEADLIVSIHQNFFEESIYNGAQVFYGNTNGSEDLASYIQDRLRTDLQPGNNRQIKSGGDDIYLLKNTSIPSVIVECGFLSNYEEAELLCQEDYQQKVALSVFLAIDEYVNH